ncbi:MAG: prepilin-type N-terminal cleavage/methylation domain-containing protein [Verrucomicrobiae bacterium]|nr:prepilin-type N-terminal cleavage/methylation domain-containing protein [Verrucomicrobiae bacterium]
MRKDHYGFTLLEVIVSMTIMALVVTVLYSAFSTGTRVWEDQDNRLAAVQERFIVTRLLARDFEQLRPYSFSWEKGKGFFFAGDREKIFYATTNGLAARDRDKGALFFSCAFLVRDDESGTLSLRMFKSPYPTNEMAQALHDFRMQAEADSEDALPYTLPATLLDESIILLDNLDQAGFIIDFPERVSLTDENATDEGRSENDAEGNGTEVETLDELEDEAWKKNRLPSSVQFAFSSEGRNFTIFSKVLMAVDDNDTSDASREKSQGQEAAN